MKKAKRRKLGGAAETINTNTFEKIQYWRKGQRAFTHYYFLISHKSRSFCSAATKHLCADVSTVGNILIQRWSHGHVVAPPSLVKTWASQYIYVTCLYLPLIIPKRFLVARALGLLLHFYINPSSRKKKHAFSLLT